MTTARSVSISPAYLQLACIMEAKIENKDFFVCTKWKRLYIIVKAVRTLGYGQPADVTIRKTLGLTFIFKECLCSTLNGKCAIAS